MTSLLDLPPEVLHLIYDWLRLTEFRGLHHSQTRNAPPGRFSWAFNSHALRPYTQAYRYHTVVVTSHASWEKLATTLKGAPWLGLAVREVVLDGLGARLYYRPPLEGEGQRDSEGRDWAGEAGEVWRRVGRVRVVRVRGFEFAFEGLRRAVEGGLRLEVLESLEVGNVGERLADPYDLARWRNLLGGLPALHTLQLDASAAIGIDEAYPVPADTPDVPFATRVTALHLAYRNFQEEAALARFANAFPVLNSLELTAGTRSGPPGVLRLLRLPGLKRLTVRWHFRTRMMPSLLGSVDVRHLAALEHLTFAARYLTPGFCFRLPPSLTHLSIEWDNTVPLSALLALVTPSSPWYHPTLSLITLDLPFAGPHRMTIEHMSDEELAEIAISEGDLMEWTEEVSEEGLEELIDAAEAAGVEVAGNCRAVWRLEEAYEWQEERNEAAGRQADEFGYGGAFDDQ